MATITRTRDPQVHICITAFEDLLRGYAARDFVVRFWDGTTWDPDPQQPTNFTLVLNHLGSLRRMFWPPVMLSFGQAYLYDDFNVEGDMLAFARLCTYLDHLKPTLSVIERLRLGWRFWNLPKLERPYIGRQAAQLQGAVHSRDRDREAIAYHYDMPPEFWGPLLGPLMVYTSAVFGDRNEDLHAAQVRKLDLICRKLRLKRGDRLLDIGCGWGGLIMHAAKNYGVTAVGVTNNQKQIEWMRPKIQAAGLADRCRVDLMDYRDIDEREPFDHITIMEVTEHFGAAQFPTFFQKARRLLRATGQLFIMKITQADLARMPGALEFSQSYIFPDGELVPLSFTLKEAEKEGFEARDVEALGEHYALTVKHWLRNVEANHDVLVQATDEVTFRIFRLHFAGCYEAFTNHVYSLHHILLAKVEDPTFEFPLGREDWYPGTS